MTLYDDLIVEIFRRHDGANSVGFEFSREELAEILNGWGKSVRNLGDVPYTYRGGRRSLPTEIEATGNWVIEGRGKGVYAFRKLERSPYIEIPVDLQRITVLDATPDIILKYGGADEQGLLATVRYNRLIDTFLGITAYHLQSHMRTFIEGSGQIEIDDLYVGIDTDGRRYLVPIEAKTATEPLGITQIVGLNMFGKRVYPELVLRTVAVKSWNDESIFFIEFNNAVDPEAVEVIGYKRYRLVREETQARTPQP